VISDLTDDLFRLRWRPVAPSFRDPGSAVKSNTLAIAVLIEENVGHE
jgi:hypothetical protein